MTAKFRQIPLPPLPEYSSKEMQLRSRIFFENLSTRRTIRNFSDKPIPRDVIENCIKTASTAPSGANMQPWHFVVISDPEIKMKIRVAAEKEEKEYLHRGIARRAFSRSFTLSDDIVVKGADLVNGMLTIDLERIVPEEKKSRLIEIGQADESKIKKLN